jgi:hypothetical protein
MFLVNEGVNKMNGTDSLREDVTTTLSDRERFLMRRQHTDDEARAFYSGPDYKGGDREGALADVMTRLDKHFAQVETLDDDTFEEIMLMEQTFRNGTAASILVDLYARIVDLEQKVVTLLHTTPENGDFGV